mgnify:CR=1 FL=1
MNLLVMTRLAIIATAIELVHTSITIFIIQYNVVDMWYSLEIIETLNEFSYLIFLVNLMLYFIYLKIRSDAVTMSNRQNRTLNVNIRMYKK